MPEYDLHSFRLTVDTADGTYDVAAPGGYLRRIGATLTYSIGGRTHALSLVRGARVRCPGGPERVVVLNVASPPLAVETTFTARRGDSFLEVRSTVTLTDQGDDVRLLAITPVEVSFADTGLARAGREACRFWHDGPDGWARPGTRPLGERTHADDVPQNVSYWHGSFFRDRSSPAITFCHLLPCRWVNAIENRPGSIAVSWTFDVPLRSGTPVRSDRLFVNLDEPPVRALASFAARQVSRRAAAQSVEGWGWNSWDYYRDHVTEQDVLENAAEIARRPWMREKIRHIIVDDAWERWPGDWEPNERFPSGMDGMADRIAALGFVPGIWTAPFMADVHSELFQAHPDWAVRYKGEPYSPWKIMGCGPVWGDRVYLDPTHPGVRDHVYGLYRKLYGWGYRYFKTDFLVNPIRAFYEGEQSEHRPDLRYHDASAGLQAAHRACMEAIRAAVGEDSFWLGCGSHLATCAGLVDASRIGSDIGVFYYELLSCARPAVFRFHLHGGIWLNDPDFAVFRGSDTFDPAMLDVPPAGKKPYGRHVPGSGPPFSEREARLWASLIILSGGLVTLSDRIKGLNERGLRIVRTVLENAGGRAAWPVDIENPLPRILYKEDRGRAMLGLLNLDDDAAAAVPLDGVPMPRCGEACDVWSGEPVRLPQGAPRELGPRECRLYAWEL